MDNFLNIAIDSCLMASDKPRPIIIAILAILYFIIGVLGIIAGILVITGGVALDQISEGEGLIELGAGAGAVIIVLSLISLIIAGGFWNGWKIMWYIGVIFTIISLIGGIASIFVGGFIGIIPLIIDIIILWYLFRPNVKAFFGV